MTAREVAKQMVGVEKVPPKNRSGWGPCKTHMEFCEEFGVSRTALSDFIRHHNGPAPCVSFTATSTKIGKTYYQTAAMRKWWAELQAKKAI